MANIFRNASNAGLGITPTAIYTTPAATTTVIHSIFLTNIHASLGVKFTLQLFDSSAGTTILILNQVLVPVNTTTILDKPLNLETGDRLDALVSIVSSGSIILSVLEIT